MIYYLIAASSSFIFLNCVTLSSFGIAGKSHLLFPIEVKVEEPEQQKIRDEMEFRLHLEMDSEYFSWVRLLNDTQEQIIKTKVSKPSYKRLLDKGTYTIEAKLRKTGKVYRVEYTLSSKTHIYCGNPDGINPVCIDHNDSTLIRIVDREEEEE